MDTSISSWDLTASYQMVTRLHLVIFEKMLLPCQISHKRQTRDRHSFILILFLHHQLSEVLSILKGLQLLKSHLVWYLNHRAQIQRFLPLLWLLLHPRNNLSLIMPVIMFAKSRCDSRTNPRYTNLFCVSYIRSMKNTILSKMYMIKWPTYSVHTRIYSVNLSNFFLINLLLRTQHLHEVLNEDRHQGAEEKQQRIILHDTLQVPMITTFLNLPSLSYATKHSCSMIFSKFLTYTTKIFSLVLIFLL
mmetsp:Transcript_4537/g.5577  ORF Transcript_4537/g.5577 Transcript_4537/m.5577 type:complete len:247 (-) Transcript_4537:193-933(-)